MRLFEARVRETPDAEAVVAGEERLTYRQLNARANRLAHALRQKGVQRNDIVGLAVERDADVAIGILAILKAGAAYLPLDPDYPRDRLAFIVDDAKARLVLASSKITGSLQLEGAECLDIATAGTGLPDTDPMPHRPPMTSPTSSTPQAPQASQRASSSHTPTSRASSAQPTHGSPSAHTTPGPSSTPTRSTSPSGSCGGHSSTEGASSSSHTGSAEIPPPSASSLSTSASPSSTRPPPLSAS